MKFSGRQSARLLQEHQLRRFLDLLVGLDEFVQVAPPLRSILSGSKQESSPRERNAERL